MRGEHAPGVRDMENTFRAGREGIDHLIEGLAKVQKHAHELEGLG